MHRRLDECYPSDESFGNRDWIVLGDLLQLKPVKAQYVCEGLTLRDTGAILRNATEMVHLWSEFAYYELTINMRHKADETWGALNTNIRLGILTDEHDRLLQSRIIQRAHADETKTMMACRVYKQLMADTRNKGNILIICSRKETCHAINMALLDSLDEVPRVIEASDIRGKHGKDVEKMRDSDAGGLAKRLVRLLIKIMETNIY